MNQNAQYSRNIKCAGDSIFFISNNNVCELKHGLCVSRITDYGNITNIAVNAQFPNTVVFISDAESKADLFIAYDDKTPERLTFFDWKNIWLSGWINDDIFIASTYESYSRLRTDLYKVSLKTGIIEKLAFGEDVNAIITTNDNALIIQKNGYGYGSWNNYQGGQVGFLLKEDSSNEFNLLLRITHNIMNPVFYKNRIYFMTDVTGIGNIHSCDINGNDMQQHTFEKSFCVMSFDITSSGKIMYISGGIMYGLENNQVNAVQILFHTNNRKNITLSQSESINYLDSISVSDDHHLAVSVRGQTHRLNGGYNECYAKDGHRISAWINKDELISVKANQDYEIWKFGKENETLPFGDLGLINHLVPSPDGTKVLATNNRHQLYLLDMESKESCILDEGSCLPIDKPSWSPDSQWIAYSYGLSSDSQVIKIIHISDKEKFNVTPESDVSLNPVFDETGKYLLFIKSDIDTALDFPYITDRLHNVYVINLDPANRMPVSQSGIVQNQPDKDKVEDADTKTDAKVIVKIDTENIQSRVERIMSVKNDFYHIIGCNAKGPIWITSVDHHAHNEELIKDKYIVEQYEWETRKIEHLADDISDAVYSKNWTVYVTGNKIITCKTGDKLGDENKRIATQNNGGIWELPSIHINLQEEWRSIFGEAWRLQKEHFFDGSKKQINWDELYAKYSALLQYINTRDDLNEVIKQLHGSLECSHAYIRKSGDTKQISRVTNVGNLLADWKFEDDAWKIKKLHGYGSGLSPLEKHSITANTKIFSINNVLLDKKISPQQALVGQSNKVRIDTDRGMFDVEVANNNTDAYYYDWIQQNIKIVGPKLGYVHIHDMCDDGFRWFYKQYVHQHNKPGLIIDIRHNGGGNASQIIFSYLLGKHLGYDETVYHGKLKYMQYAPSGPLVLLINEHTSSDGDIFAAAFKLMKLGAAIGMRTWGGTVGVWPKYSLTDKGLTSQPQFPLYLQNEGFSIENKGVTPDIIVENKPHDKVDYQLLTAIEYLKNHI